MSDRDQPTESTAPAAPPRKLCSPPSPEKVGGVKGKKAWGVGFRVFRDSVAIYWNPKEPFKLRRRAGIGNTPADASCADVSGSRVQVTRLDSSPRVHATDARLRPGSGGDRSSGSNSPFRHRRSPPVTKPRAVRRSADPPGPLDTGIEQSLSRSRYVKAAGSVGRSQAVCGRPIAHNGHG